MKKILNLTVLMLCSMTAYGAANKFSTITNKSVNNDLLVISNGSGILVNGKGGYFYKNPEEGSGRAIRNFEVTKNKPYEIDFNTYRFGTQNDDEAPFIIFETGDNNEIYKEALKEKNQKAMFVSKQENGKEYFLLDNWWDDSPSSNRPYVDFLIISREDLEKPEWALEEEFVKSLKEDYNFDINNL